MLKRVISLILSLVMVFSVMPVSAWATELEQPAAGTQSATEPAVTEEAKPVCTGLADCAAEEHKEDCICLEANTATNLVGLDDGSKSLNEIVYVDCALVVGYLYVRSTPDAANNSNLMSLVLAPHTRVLRTDITSINGVSWSRIDYNGTVGYVPSEYLTILKSTVTPPTCTEKGYTTDVCTCGRSYERDYLDSWGHTEVIDEAVEATCTTDGLTEGKHCSVCGEVLEEQEVIPASHNVENGICTRCEKNGTCGENLVWTLTEDGTLTISGNGAMDDYSNDHTNPAPWNCVSGDVTKLVLEEGITEIGDYAFKDCSALEEGSFPSTLERVGEAAFYKTRFGSGVYFQSFPIDINMTVRQWSEVRIETGNEYFPNSNHVSFVHSAPVIASGMSGDKIFWELYEDGSMKFFGSGEMYDDFWITGPYVNLPIINVTIGEGIVNLGTGIFEGGDGFLISQLLESITIASTVKRVENIAFSNCGALNTIKFTGDAPTIGENSFWNVTATAYYPAGNETWTEEVMQDYGGEITWEAYETGPAIIASGTCGTNLTWTLDAEGVLMISGYGSMADIPIDGSTGQYQQPWRAWQDDIKAVVIESGVTEVVDQAIGSCKNLEIIAIPASVTKLGECAILYCPSLKEIQVEDGNQYYCSADGVLYSEDMTTLIKYPASRPGTEYTVPDTVTELLPLAFDSAAELVSITLPDDITTLGTDTFADCTSLKYIHLPENLTDIEGTGVFWNCSSLETIEIPDSVQQIGASTFSGCTSLKQIDLPSNLQMLDDGIFGRCKSLEAITIPANITSLGHLVFWDSGLKEITFEGDSPSFWEDTFNGFDLGGVTATAYYPAGNETWTEDVLQDYGGNIDWAWMDTDGNCAGACDVDLFWEFESTTGTLTISGTGPMGNFYDNTVADETFAPWRSLRDRIHHIVIEDGVTNIEEDLFVDYLNLRSVSIPNSVAEIGEYVFGWDAKLKTVNLPNQLKKIKFALFIGCSGLNEIILPDTVTSIGLSAFRECTGLTNVTIPSAVINIDNYAFGGCSGLNEITFEGNAPSLGEYVFLDVNATAYYPAGNETWTEEVRQNYGGNITWMPYGDVVEEEKVLFATWDDFSNYMYDFPELPVNMMTMLVFCFGSEDDYVILSDNLTAGGCITMSPGATVNGNQVWNIWPTEMGPGTVTYTDPDTGKTYTFDVTVIEPWEGGEGEGPGGEGPGEEVDDSVIRLFARWDDASGFMESSEIRLDCTSPFVFCFGTYEDHIYVTDLELSGVATLSEQYTTADGAPGYHLGVSGLGEGFVKYTHTDGVEYTYSVQGILGYPGDLIAVCKDPNRGYGGLEFMPYLTVGESFEAEFAVLDSMTTYRMLSEDAVYTTEGIATLERVNGTVYAIGVSGEGEGMIHYTEGDQSGTMYVYGNTEGQGPGGEGPGGDQGYPGVQNVQYRGQTVSVFIGDVWDDELHDIQGYGDNYGPRYYQDFHFRFLLGALADFDTNREALPPAEFYDCISDISFYLENTANEHPGDEKLNCWLTNDPDGDWQDCVAIDPAPYENEALGIYSAQTHLRAKAGQGFQATVCMTFTYDDPSDDIEATTYTVKISGGYASSGDVVLDLSAGKNAALVDTAEELNAIVGDYDTLLDWLETNFPESFQDHKPGATVTLNLPAVEYKDILTVNAKSDDGNTIGTNICLRGSTDENGNRTTLPGILAQAGLHEVLDIDFVYDPKVTYGDVLGNNKELSYGILADCRPGMEGTAEENGAFWNDVCNVGNCTFTGFDYGMMSTEYGYAGPAWGCTFTDCYYGIYMDCKDQGAGGNDNFSGNTFIGSKFAVCLRSLPGGSTPYSMRFHDNVFQKCDKEFKVTTSGNKHYFYFYRNYYDGSYHDGWKRAVTGETPRGARVELVDENGVQSSAVVLTDPCRINADMSVEGGLWIFGDSTCILNAEADQLLIAQGALQDTRIGILDNNEEEIALWTFEKAAQVGYALQENNFNAGITISEIEDGIVGVTVGNDTQTDAILQERMPTLSVDCAFDEAYVMCGDRVIFSTLENGQISFTAAQGGEYRIVRGQASVTFAAMIGAVGYESLAQALAAAKNGDTIELAADVSERNLVVRKGITLNLNGYMLETDYIFAVNGANIVDESEGNTGLLKADADCVLISKGNAQLPVWNGEGYVFTKVTYRKALVAHDKDMVKFAFLPMFQSVATELLKDGFEGNKVTVEVRVSWETIQGREYRNLVFNNDQVALGISSGGAFILTFSGFSQLNLASGVAIEAVVYSETGVSVASEAIVVDVTPA